MALRPAWASQAAIKDNFKFAIEQFAVRKLNDRFNQGNAAYARTLEACLEANWNGYQGARLKLAKIIRGSARAGSTDGTNKVFEQVEDQLEQEAYELSVEYAMAKQIITDSIKLLEGGLEAELPKYDKVFIPKFNGKYTKWAAWSAEYESKVLKQNYPTFAKIDILAKSLEGGRAKCAAGSRTRRDGIEADVGQAQCCIQQPIPRNPRPSGPHPQSEEDATA